MRNINHIPRRVRWPDGSETVHRTLDYSAFTGRLTLEQKPIEGHSRYCQHSYPLRLRSAGGCYEWSLFPASDIKVQVIAADGPFTAEELL